MKNMTLLNRSGLAAIAAATAFLATPALAQDAAPVSAEPAPIVADEPLPAEPTIAPEAASDPLAPAATTTTTTKRTTRTTRPARATTVPAARIARAPAPVVRNTAPAAVAPVAPVEEALPPVDPAMVAPLPEPVAAPPAPVASESMIDNDLLPIAGAAGLGILALAGAGFAMRRRRREEDEVVEEVWHEPAMSRPAEPVAPITVAPLVAAAPTTVAAFNWGNAPRQPAPALSPDRRISRIEAAKRGPTPDNPSRSLKKRLSRASFFDQRERMVEAGKAAPMSAMAGLPKALVHAEQPEPRPEPATRMNFNRSFQPA